MQTLINLFVKQDIATPKGQQTVTTLCSVVSIVLNLLLFTGKIVGGLLSGSVSISADAFNNLADAGTCLVEFFGFQFASVGPGKKHPFGHGRIEWLMGLFAAIAVLFVGYEMAKSSLMSILSPSPVQLNVPIVLVLVVSILVKFFMFLYNRNTGIQLNSIALRTKAIDSISDMAATSAVLISSLISYTTGLQLDGWCAMIVSVFILYAGFKALTEAIHPLIGSAPTKELIQKIKQVAQEYPQVLEIYDIMVHDYGFHKRIAACHITGSHSDIKRLACICDEISYRLLEECNCETTVQIDLTYTDESAHQEILSSMTNALNEISSDIQISDLRIIEITDSYCISVALAMPLSFAKKEADIKSILKNCIGKLNGDFHLLLKTQVYVTQNKFTKLFLKN